MKKELIVSTDAKSFGIVFHGNLFALEVGGQLFNMAMPVLIEYDRNTDHYLFSEVRSTGRKPTLKEMQELVGGWIDIISGHVPYDSDRPVFVINDEGKFPEDHYPNAPVTLYARKHGYIFPDDYIAGPVMVIESNRID